MKRKAVKGSFDKKRVEIVKASMKPDDIVARLAETFKVLGDFTRTKIIFALSKKELCVNDIAVIVRMSHSAVSHQLSVLRHMKLVTLRKEGRTAYYALDDVHISHLFAEGIRHVEE